MFRPNIWIQVSLELLKRMAALLFHYPSFVPPYHLLSGIYTGASNSLIFLSSADCELFASIPKSEFPLHESLQDLVQRTVPFWLETIAPEIAAGKRVLVVAHGTSLRGLVKHIKDVVSPPHPRTHSAWPLGFYLLEMVIERGQITGK
jgi:hypothetical protein